MVVIVIVLTNIFTIIISIIPFRQKSAATQHE